MDKKNTLDREFFDNINFESFKTTVKDADNFSEEELKDKFEKFEEDDPLDINDPEHFVFILETYNSIRAGLIWLAIREPFWRFDKQLAWIYNLHIAPGFRKQGLARILMIKAEEWAFEQKLDLIVLHVLDDNTFARSLYESLGYKLIHTHNESCFYEKVI